MSGASLQRPLRRSLLFVPGSEPRKLEKAHEAGADTLLFDLEDSVALAEKDRARGRVAERLRSGGFGPTEPAVRVNPPGTPYFDDDLDAAVGAGAAAILLPKCEDPAALEEVAERIGALERRNPGRAAPVRLLALVETAAGVVCAAALAAAPRVDALCFGHADFSRDLGLEQADASRGVVLHARCALAIAARAGGATPIDTIALDVRDADAFRRDAELGRSLGFEGKLCIHPSQVAIANEAYAPTAGQIEFAERVLAEAQRAEREGKGVFTVDGKMIDAPLVAAQRRVLERAHRAARLAATGGADA